MHKAFLITIGTEITSGEVVNSNAAWVSAQLEDMGVRVYGHLTIPDQREDILKALKLSEAHPLTIVTGGLGPTSDDITRECMAEYTGTALEFDEKVHQLLAAVHAQRGLQLKEAHKHQCWFPVGSDRLRNPVGTALGFHMQLEQRHYIVLPGPPRELEGMWREEVSPRLQKILPKTDYHWQRWTTLGLPESEVAELVEKAIENSKLEVGYRAAVPYVKVKLYVDRTNPKHDKIVAAVDAALAPSTVERGYDDLANELLERWPLPELVVWDFVTDGQIAHRLFSAQRGQVAKQAKFPHINVHAVQSTEALPSDGKGVQVRRKDNELIVTLSTGSAAVSEHLTLPYKVSLNSERGKLSAAEWVFWFVVRALRAL